MGHSNNIETYRSIFGRAATGGSESAPTSSISMLHDTNEVNFKSGTGNMAALKVNEQQAGSVQQAGVNSDIAFDTKAAADNTVAQADAVLEERQEVIESTITEQGHKLHDVVCHSDSANAGAMTVNFVGAMAGVGDAIGFVGDLIEEFRKNRNGQTIEDLQDKIVSALRVKANANPAALTSDERAGQQAAQTIVNLYDAGHSLQDIYDARNNLTQLPELRGVCQTQDEAEKMGYSLASLEEENIALKDLDAGQQAALGMGLLKNAAQEGGNIEHLAGLDSKAVDLMQQGLLSTTCKPQPGTSCNLSPAVKEVLASVAIDEVSQDPSTSYEVPPPAAAVSGAMV